MPGFNPNALNPRVESGNSVVLLIGDQPIAFAQTVTHGFGLGAETFYGVGSAKPQEIQQLRDAPSITVDNFALTTNGVNLLQSGVTFASIIANNQFNISLLDAAQRTKFTYVGCVADNFNESIAANRPITDAITFSAMDVLDQSGQSILDGPNAFAVPSTVGVSINGGLGISVTGTGVSLSGNIVL